MYLMLHQGPDGGLPDLDEAEIDEFAVEARGRALARQGGAYVALDGTQGPRRSPNTAAMMRVVTRAPTIAPAYATRFAEASLM